MKKSDHRTNLSRVVYTLSVVVFAAVSYFGCSSGAKMTTEQMTAMDTAEKARQDSIRNFELLKNWSFGRTNYQNKEYDRVTPYLWKVIQTDAEDRFKDVYSLLADTYFKLGKGDSSQMVYQMGVKKFPDNVYLQRNLGYLHMQKQEIDKATTFYEAVVKLEPDGVADWVILADLYVKGQQNEKALLAYKKLAALEPDNPEYPEKMVALMGDSGEVLKMLQSMAAKNPDDAKTIMELANYFRKERDWEKSAEWLEKYNALQPEDVLALEDLALMYKNIEAHEKAIGAYDKLLTANPKDVRAMTGKAEAQTALGNLRAGLATAKRAVNLDSKYGRAHIAVGKVYEKTVDQCMIGAGRKSPNFDDKLVYEMAFKAYQRAAKDVSSRDFAQQLVSSLDPVIPKKADLFMNQGQTKPKADCYSWLY